jgi:hypothetical protein
MSRYDAVDRYTYPGTGVLINKVGITDAQALDAFEADATAIRMFELFQDPVPGSFNVDHVKLGCCLMSSPPDWLFIWVKSMQFTHFVKAMGGSSVCFVAS